MRREEKIRQLLAASEATVLIHDQSPGNHGKVIVGLRVDPKKLDFIGIAGVFDEMIGGADNITKCCED